MNNPLLSPTALEISPAVEQARKVELLEQTDASLYDLRRRKADIELKRQDLDIERKEENLETASRLNKRINSIVENITDPDVAERLISTVKTGKDYNEMIKAAQGVVKLRDDLLDRVYDDTVPNGKKKKIEFAFQGGGYKMAMRVESDGE